ncbi:unnamed protein product [Owenia fusiformis]|uniref:Uncharacterized protein n=1 Tax=Owenia fusiformis TaxID=6347 RepID=A0A8J1U288_OWEFU|nr:unnamed protein product [Owenia fusiformis]
MSLHLKMYIGLLVFAWAFTKSGAQECGADLILVVDISCSITSPNKTLMRDFLEDFVGVLDVGTDDSQIQLGMVLFDKFTYHPIYLNSFTKNEEYAEVVREMDMHIEPNKGPRCGTRTDKALVDTMNVMLKEENGLRTHNPNILKVVMVITDGATFPASAAPKTKAAAKELRIVTGASVYVLSLPNKNNIDGSKEFRALASKPVANYLIDVSSFADLTPLIPPLMTAICVIPESEVEEITPPPTTTAKAVIVPEPVTPGPTTPRPTPRPTAPQGLCEGPRLKCQVFMSACPHHNRQCCGCHFMFIDPDTKGLKTPFQMAREGKCLCEDCIRKAWFCLPKQYKAQYYIGPPLPLKFGGYGRKG